MKPIFSDDPQAIEKLQRKLEQLEREQAYMKMINAGYKKHGEEWVKQQVTPETYRFYINETKYSWNKGKFYPAWALSNNGAVIRSTRKRIEELTRQQEQVA
jgi:hypothetical protein